MGIAGGGGLAAIGFARSNSLDGLSELTSIPVENLLLILIGMPLTAAAWPGCSPSANHPPSPASVWNS